MVEGIGTSSSTTTKSTSGSSAGFIPGPIVIAGTIVMGPWKINAKDDGLYATHGGTVYKIELIDLSKGEIPPPADP